MKPADKADYLELRRSKFYFYILVSYRITFTIKLSQKPFKNVRMRRELKRKNQKLVFQKILKRIKKDYNKLNILNFFQLKFRSTSLIKV